MTVTLPPFVVHWADDPTRHRLVRRACRICDRQYPIDLLYPQVISASGIVHHADGDTTLCGKRATSDEWWWSV